VWLLMLLPVSVKGGELRCLVSLLGFSLCMLSVGLVKDIISPPNFCLAHNTFKEFSEQ